MRIDIISDLHEDFWNSKVPSSLYSDKTTDLPLNLIPSPNTDILIVAGNISADLHISLKFLENCKRGYKYVLFVDGDKEHHAKLPNMYSPSSIVMELNKSNLNNIYYLPIQPFLYDDIAFVGVSGWWNFSESIPIQFENTNLSTEDNNKLVRNIIKSASLDYKHLDHVLSQIELDTRIKTVIVVTHTPPHSECVDDNISLNLNALMRPLVSGAYSKLKYWIFGHVKNQISLTINNIQFISNPRGYDRKEYQAINISF